MSTQAVILEALRTLANQDQDNAQEQNGVGFSKPDSYRGKQLASRLFLNEDEAAEALTLLQKYSKTQLTHLALPEVEQARTEARVVEAQAGRIELEDDSLIVIFDYNKKHVAAVKTIQEARFTTLGERKFWRVPLKRGADLLKLFPDFIVSSEAKGAVEDYTPPAIEYVGRVVIKEPGFLDIHFEYNPDILARVKEKLPNARFRTEDYKKFWRTPFEDYKILLEHFQDFGYDVAVRQAIVEYEDKQRIVAQAEQAVTAKLNEAQIPANFFAHQKAGVEWLLAHRRGILGDDMGLGKTRQALVTAHAFGVPILVVAPASLQINWQREAAEVSVPISTFSWAKIPKPPAHPYVLIADEAHYAQSLKSNRTKAFLALALDDNCMGCFPLTGTPMKNGRPVNLFPLLQAIRHPLAKNKSKFEKRYCDAHATKWTRWDVSGASNLDELHAMTKDAILRRTKKEALDLPDKMRVLRQVELSDAGRKLYLERFNELRAEYKRRVATNEISDNAKGLVLLDNLRLAGSIAKVDGTIELALEVNEQGGQTVIFVAFKESGTVITEALGGEFLSGDASREERQRMVDDFQAGKLKNLVCTFGAGGVGITLTAAQTVILVDRPWTPGDATQAEDRLHRIGQKNAVTALWLQYGPADEKIDAILEDKLERIDLVLAGKRKTMRGIGSIKDVADELLQEIFNDAE